MTALLELSDRHQADLVALEDATAHSATEPLRRELASITAAIMAVWAAAFGSTHARPEPAAVRPLADRLGTRLDVALGKAAAPAWLRATKGSVHALATGQRQARAEAALFERAAPVPPLGALPGDVQSALAGIGPALAEQRAGALAALLSSATYGALTAALGHANGAVNRIDLAARWAVVRSAAAGARSYADANALQLVWAAEPDACFVCADAAGIVLGTGQPFPLSHKFGQPHRPDEAEPPAHPRCRCRMVVWRPTWTGAATLSADLRARAGGSAESGAGPTFAPFVAPRSLTAVVSRLLRGRAA